MTYLLDANVFIQAKNLYYGFDFCPAFWDWLVEWNTDGKVFSIGACRIVGGIQVTQAVSRDVIRIETTGLSSPRRRASTCS